MNNESLVSIIITTYNRPEMLRKAIQSVFDQTYHNFELIVVNDAGERVDHIIDEFSDRMDIQYIHKDYNEGLGYARNTGLNIVKGKYVNFLDDDDSMYPHHIETLVRFAKKNNYKIVYGDAVYYVYRNKQLVAKQIVYSFDYDADMLLYQNITPVNAVMFEYDDVIKKIKFGKERVYEDWRYWLKCTEHYDMHHIDIPICVVTSVDDGSTMSSSRNEFTTLLPEIYKENWPRAKNQVLVATAMNDILARRGKSPMFQIQ